MRTIPLTVLVHDSPTARVYLSALSLAQIRPAKIILMIRDRHPGSGRPIGRWLPPQLRRSLAKKTQNISMFYWPRTLRKSHKTMINQMQATISQVLAFPSSIFDELEGSKSVEDYGEDFESILISSLNDDILFDVLNKLAPGAVLFTGGGILPNRIIEIPGLKLIHIHPGLLPHIRGSDGLLWSYLIRGKPGVSCFYMASGIDTGEIIAAEEFATIQFKFSKTRRPDDQTLYRMIFSFFDPILRARMMLNALSLGNDLTILPSKRQNTDVGTTYHFMSKEVRRAALLRIFPES